MAKATKPDEEQPDHSPQPRPNSSVREESNFLLKLALAIISSLTLALGGWVFNQHSQVNLLAAQMDDVKKNYESKIVDLNTNYKILSSNLSTTTAQQIRDRADLEKQIQLVSSGTHDRYKKTEAEADKKVQAGVNDTIKKGVDLLSKKVDDQTRDRFTKKDAAAEKGVFDVKVMTINKSIAELKVLVQGFKYEKQISELSNKVSLLQQTVARLDKTPPPKKPATD